MAEERETLLGADAPQRQAEPGLDLGQRVLAVGGQQHDLVGGKPRSSSSSA